MAERFKNLARTTLSGAITSSATSLSVSDASRFPTAGNFRLLVESELMLVTAVSANTFTVSRGVEGTTAVAHDVGREVSHIVTSGSLYALKLQGSFSPVTSATRPNGTPPSAISGDANYTVGSEFAPLDTVWCLGVRFYWATPNKTVKTALRTQAGTLLATVNVAVTTAGVYEGFFGSAVQLDAFNYYRATAYQTDGLNYTRTTHVDHPAVPFIGGPYLLWTSTRAWAAGDASPTSLTTIANERYIVEPILELL